MGPAHLARTRRCRVVAIDISEQMLEWTRIRARRDHVAHLVSTERADVLDLPFPAGSFDVLLVESVLAFVVDKQRAISECVRVTRSGGWVGMNETLWRADPPEADRALAADTALGTFLVTQAQWRTLSGGIRAGRPDPRVVRPGHRAGDPPPGSVDRLAVVAARTPRELIEQTAAGVKDGRAHIYPNWGHNRTCMSSTTTSTMLGFMLASR